MANVADHRGIREDAVEALADRIEEEIDAGRSLAAQFAIARDGEVLASRSFGAATADSRFVIFSATKTLVAMALLPHLEDGSLELTARVASIVPGFGENGKSDVTVLQLLTMQGGFPWAPMGPKQWRSSEGRRKAFASWRLDWPAGTRTEYHPLSAHWVIAEMLETLNGRPYVDVVHERVTAPAGVDRLLGDVAANPGGGHEAGIGRQERGAVVPVRTIGEHPGHEDPDLIALFGRADLVPKEVIGVDQLLFLNDPRSQVAGIPGGGAIAHATDIVRVYQSFLRTDVPWQRDAISTIRNVSLSATDGMPANRTLAGVVAGCDGYHDLRWFPAAPRAFGHHGAGGQLCWVDPDSGMSFCFLHDTLNQDPGAELTRCRDINALAVVRVPVTSPASDHHEDDLRRGAIAGISAYLIWGFLTIYWKLLKDFNAFDLIGWRIISSAVVMAVVLMVRGGWRRLLVLVHDRRLLLRVAGASVLLTVNWTSYVWAVVHGRVMETALGYFMAPLGTMLIGVLVFGERLHRAQRIAVALAAAAIAVLTFSYGAVPWLAIAIAVSWSLYGWMKKSVPLSAIESMSAEIFVLLVPAIVLVTLLAGHADSVSSSATTGEMVLVALSGVATVLPLTLFAYAAARLPLTVLGPMQYSVPTINFLLGWLVYDETLTPSWVVGFALVWTGLLVMSIDTVRRSHRRTNPDPVPAVSR